MDRVLAILAIAAYLVPLVGRRFPGSGARAVMERPLWAWLGLSCHVAALAWRLVAFGERPLGTVETGLATLALFLVIAWINLRRRPRMESLGTVLLSLVVLLLAMAQMAPAATLAGDLGGPWFAVHVILILVGFAAFILSFSLSTLFLLVRRRLKRKQLADIGRLPALETLDLLNSRAMTLGFVTLSAGMMVGGLWAGLETDAKLRLDITVMTTVAVWTWYAVGLYLRLVSGWRGRFAAVFGVVGFGGIASLMLVAGALLGGWHGWGV